MGAFTEDCAWHRYPDRYRSHWATYGQSLPAPDGPLDGPPIAHQGGVHSDTIHPNSTSGTRAVARRDGVPVTQHMEIGERPEAMGAFAATGLDRRRRERKWVSGWGGCGERAEAVEPPVTLLNSPEFAFQTHTTHIRSPHESQGPRRRKSGGGRQWPTKSITHNTKSATPPKKFRPRTPTHPTHRAACTCLTTRARVLRWVWSGDGRRPSRTPFVAE